SRPLAVTAAGGARPAAAGGHRPADRAGGGAGRVRDGGVAAPAPARGRGGGARCLPTDVPDHGMRFLLDPPLTDALREEIIGLWRDVANAGGAVGFAGQVGFDEVRTLAAAAFAAVDEGHDNLLVGYVDGRPVALLFFVSHRFPL